MWRDSRNVIVSPEETVQKNVSQSDAGGIVKIDEFPADGRSRPFQVRIFILAGGRFKKNEKELPVREPVGIAEVRDHACGTHQVEEIMSVIVHLGGFKQLVHFVHGSGISAEGVEPDSMVDGGILDLPVSPVIVSQGFAQHLPFWSVGMIRKGAQSPGQGFRPQSGPVHRSPFLSAEKIGHALGDQVFDFVLLGFVEDFETIESVVRADIPHHREEIRKGRDTVCVVRALFDG